MKTKILLILLFIPLLATAGFVSWGMHPLPAAPEALLAMQSDAIVNIESHNDFSMFIPLEDSKDVGIIFYPGGHVDPRAYAPILRQLAGQGYPVALVPMPLNLAFLGKNKADEIIQRFPQIDTWIIAGHSLGGAMAAQYADQHAQALSGLVLLASYPPQNTSLQTAPIKVLSIYGELDGITTLDDIESSKKNLPADAQYFQIDGGNHAQFGSYGWQNGDLAAEIPAAQQQNLAADILIEFLAALD